MTTRIERIIFNRDRSEEDVPEAKQMHAGNQTITAENIKSELGVTIPGLGKIIDNGEATIIEGKISKKGKRAKFIVDGYRTDDNPGGDPKAYVSFAFKKQLNKGTYFESNNSNELIVRGNVFKDGQTVGLRVTRL